MNAAGELQPVQREALEFPPPPCPYCAVDCEVGDGFACPVCGASWPIELAHLHEGERPCVQCDRDAEVTGRDGQPRCRQCEGRVATGQLRPVGPYDCGTCRTRVVGVGARRPAREQLRCGRCFVRVEDERLIAAGPAVDQRTWDARPVLAGQGGGGRG